MKDMQWISCERIGQKYAKLTHKSGLTMLLCPMEGYRSAYAIFATPLGSVDAAFRTSKQDEFTKVPAGTAHFLEHKMFENEDGDAFARYASTGASANAYTSFDKTCYLFSCTENFPEALEILLDFVQRPYFTKESVQKEQGIIGQEIKMYDDNGDWRVMFNLLETMYQNHPVRLDIAGTVDSIGEITPEVLYNCHKAFYNLGQMVLCVAGNFDIETVLSVADKVLQQQAPAVQLERAVIEEPETVGGSLIAQKLSVALPLFYLGFKGKSGESSENAKNQILDELLLDIICGDASPFYRTLYDEGLINSEFDSECMSGPGYLCNLYSGESRNPQAVAERLRAEVARLQREGIDPSLFELCRKSAYGQYVGMYTRTESVANLLVGAHFAGMDSMYYPLDVIAAATLEDVTNRLQQGFDAQHSALSIIWPIEEGEA